MAVQIGRDEDDLNPVLRKIFKTETLAAWRMGSEASYRSRWLAMGGFPGSGLGGVALERGDQIRVVAEDENKGDDGLVRPPSPGSAGRGPTKEVDPLVVEFAASRDQHDSGVGGEIPSQEPGCGGKRFSRDFSAAVRSAARSGMFSMSRPFGVIRSGSCRGSSSPPMR